MSDTRQPFARHPELAAEIERMAGSGHVGSLIDWDRFLSALNAALVAPAMPGEPVAWQRPDNIDAHPLRYGDLRGKIERILLRRLRADQVDGYTLETSTEIAELLDAAPTSPGWQPIASAPKDGTVIDVWVVDSRGSKVGGRRYADAIWRNSNWMWWDAYYAKGGGYIGLDNGVNVCVTHWMPLPPAPEVTA